MTTLQQGYLQYVPPGSDQAQKVFVSISNQQITIFPEDPSKFDQPIPPISRLNLQKSQLIESGDFQRPKSFGIVTDRGNLIEFSCPTNSVRSAWIKSITDNTTNSSNQRYLAASQNPPQSGANSHNNVDIYRTPVSSLRIPSASNLNHSNNPNQTVRNRFSDFDGFADQALNQLHSLKNSFGSAATNRASQGMNPAPSNSSSALGVRVIQPTVSKSFVQPPASNAANVALPQPAIRRNPAVTQKPSHSVPPPPSSHQSARPTPKWIPGHYKASTLVSNVKAISPQRARNAVRNQPQAASTLLGRSHSAPGFNLNTNNSNNNNSMMRQYSQANSTLQQQPDQYNLQHSRQFYQPAQQLTQPHPHASESNLPLEKMTLEQLRQAFLNMPNELKSAIVNPASQPGSRKPSAHRDRERDGEDDSGGRDYDRRRDRDGYDEKREKGSHSRGKRESDRRKYDEDRYYSDQEGNRSEENDYHPRKSNRGKESNRSNPRGERRSSRGYSPASLESDEEQNQRRRSSKSKHRDDKALGADHSEHRKEYYDGSEEHHHQYSDDEEEEIEIPPRYEKRRHSVPARLDYTDYSDPEEENHEPPLQPEELEFSEHKRRKGAEDENLPRFMRSKTAEKRSEGKYREVSPPSRPTSNPRGNRKPPLERSRSAPPASSFSPRDFSQKAKSPVPRGDLLEWSKKQAWQKHVSNGFPISKAQEKAKEVYKSVSQTGNREDSKPNQRALNEQSKQFPQTNSQRMKAVEENLRRNSLTTSNSSGKVRPNGAPGSFFDFLKGRAAAPIGAAANPAPIKGTSQEAREGNRHHQKEERNDKVSSKTQRAPPFALPNQTTTSTFNKTEKLFSSSHANPQQPPYDKLPKKKTIPSPDNPSKRAAENVFFTQQQQQQQQQQRHQSLLNQHKQSHDDVSIVSDSTQSLIRLERTQSQQHLQSNSSTPLTDVAEWQRVMTWLTSIRMEKYIPTFREHSITKLSLIELLAEDDFWELGIETADVPLIKLKVAEFSARIKSFSEEALFNPIVSNNHAKKKSKQRDAKIDDDDEAELASPLAAVADPRRPLLKVKPQRVTERELKKFLPIGDIDSFQLELLETFDYGQYVLFIDLWERFLHFYVPSAAGAIGEKHITVSQRPALYYAKQAMEFHLFVYFYVYSIRKGLQKEEILRTKAALKEYLESLAVQYESFHPLLEEKFHQAPPNSTITTATESNNATFTSALVEESIVLPGNVVPSFGDCHTDLAQESPPKPLITSREYATFAGLVFVPNPQYNPAFQALFTEEWSQALRQRLIQFISIIIEEYRKEQLKNPAVAETSAQRELPVIQSSKSSKEPLSLTKPPVKEILLEDLEAQGNGTEKLSNLTIEISPIQTQNIVVDVTTALPKRSAAVEALSHKLVPHAAMQKAENYRSIIDKPAESPQSNSSSISQLTDDTPVKTDPQQQLPVQQNNQKTVLKVPPFSSFTELPSSSFAFSKTSSNALTDAANRANLKLRNFPATNSSQPVPLPTQPIPSSLANNANLAAKPRVNPSPPKSSLQMQVDNYNKLLKQSRLSKTSTTSTNTPLAPVNQLASSSTELQIQSNSLLEEMNLPVNKDLINQIDAIIAPINQPVVGNSRMQLDSSPRPSLSDNNNNKSFKLGVTIPRLNSGSLGGMGNSLIPSVAVDNSTLADQVNRYKSLLKGGSKADVTSAVTSAPTIPENEQRLDVVDLSSGPLQNTGSTLSFTRKNEESIATEEGKTEGCESSREEVALTKEGEEIVDTFTIHLVDEKQIVNVQMEENVARVSDIIEAEGFETIGVAETQKEKEEEEEETMANHAEEVKDPQISLVDEVFEGGEHKEQGEMKSDGLARQALEQPAGETHIVEQMKAHEGGEGSEETPTSTQGEVVKDDAIVERSTVNDEKDDGGGDVEDSLLADGLGNEEEVAQGNAVNTVKSNKKKRKKKNNR